MGWLVIAGYVSPFLVGGNRSLLAMDIEEALNIPPRACSVLKTK
jgi:hypothetical protein